MACGGGWVAASPGVVRDVVLTVDGREVFDSRTMDYREVRTDVRKAQ